VGFLILNTLLQKCQIRILEKKIKNKNSVFLNFKEILAKVLNWNFRENLKI
jgi:hypothetical protein